MPEFWYPSMGDPDDDSPIPRHTSDDLDRIVGGNHRTFLDAYFTRMVGTGLSALERFANGEDPHPQR